MMNLYMIRMSTVRISRKMSSPSREMIDNVIHNSDEVRKDPKTISPKPYTPPLSFCQTMAKAKLDLQF